MLGLMQDRTLDVTTLLRRVEQVFGHKRVVTATADGEVVTTWQQVAARSRRVAGALDRLAVPPDAKVGTFGWNSQRHVELYLGVPGSGRVLHTLNHRLFAQELRYIVTDAEDDVLFIDRTLLPIVWPLIDDFPSVRWVVVMDDGGSVEIPDDPRVLDYDTLIGQSPEIDLPPVDDENRAASLCYTSGTTGRPKGVLYSHRSIVLHALMLLSTDAFGIGERDVVMPIVPMFHVNAWGLPYAAMLAGADLVLPGPAMAAADLIGQLARHHVTITAGVVTIWRSLLPLLGEADLSSLRKVISGGSALPDSLSQAWEEALNLPITSSWGMTETSPAVTISRLSTVHDGLDPDERRLVLGTPGPSLPLTEIRIVDDAGRPVAHDGTSPGELEVAGPTIAGAYAGSGDHASSFSDDGWLRTGDVATIDEYGYMRIVDRTKDLVKSGGEWISSVALENAIMAHPQVHEAAVIAIPDERWGERPLACLVPVPGATLTEDDVRRHLAGRVASWWIPEEIWILDEIPKTATGKFSKLALRTLISSRDATTRSGRAI